VQILALQSLKVETNITNLTTAKTLQT
jgi:hypothetical protein